MIVVMTDFGLEGPYTGQMKAVLQRAAPAVPVIDLFADLPPWNIQAAAYLLAAYSAGFPPGTVFLVIVDPGVGSSTRHPVAVSLDGRWFVGPDNGLFNIVARRAAIQGWYDIHWRPSRLSHSFHGRDLFAPLAAQLANGDLSGIAGKDGPDCPTDDWPDDLAAVVYIDRYGNAVTGVRDTPGIDDKRLWVGDHVIEPAPYFSAIAIGQPFWYGNSNGLIEIAVNQGRADQLLGLKVGDPVRWWDGE
ncbi:MAG: SAM-dependent chlorinase/fluorinase [Gammaproteobacteria bacterium]|nr:SAM-dependent chlorinase/fluorinase [Gammaproteobacteria bacterium]